MDTKRIIDSARNILVGKIPAPNTQVEQITLAMLYKFMDDMDQLSIDLGGKPKFFSNDFEEYSWRNIISNTVGAQKRFNLYTEAIEKFYFHPKLPQTFKDIFKNANVPYKDPDILTMFMKQIDQLSYDNSETLGDAYEYLLSILGSQGDLGQFRTPRHIIDFVVDIINPSKNETILDPACGTAGFLISAYKKILSKSTSKKTGDLLHFDEKNQILKNIVGYDIEPSMVKIAEMNMFLHGCDNPDINEYDTLTMDEKWNDKFDIILANPPFMTPTGGIKPHNRFSVPATRAELLFVDYIFEHMNRQGRGAVIVPDGVVSNSGKGSKSYVNLRKLIVDSGSVYCVVSLHPFIFKPYADVKTSVIFFDKSINTKNVLFVTINNDGYEKGERRREIDSNDLPEALKLITEYYNLLKTGRNSEVKSSLIDSIIVPINEIKTNKYILRGERYLAGRVVDDSITVVHLRDIVTKVSIKSEGNSPVYSVSNTKGFIRSDELFENHYVVEKLDAYKKIEKGYFAFNPSRINVGSIAYFNQEGIGCVSPMYSVFKIKDEYQSIVDPYYLLFILKSDVARNYINNNSKGVRRAVDIDTLLDFEVPIIKPLLQSEVSRNMRLIDSLNEVDDNLEYSFIVDEKWGLVTIESLFQIEKGKQPISKVKPGDYKLVTTADIIPSNVYDYDCEAICVPLISGKGHGVATLNNVFYVEGKHSCGNILMHLVAKDPGKVNMKFYYYLFRTYKEEFFTRLMTGTSNVGFSIDDVKSLKIPYINRTEQDEIVKKGNHYDDFRTMNSNLRTQIIDNLNEMISRIYKK